MQAVLWPHRAQGVISHASALALHDLCDVNPAHIDITVPADYRVTRVPPSVYQLHHRTLRSDDITRYEGISVVTPRRAVLDGIEAHLRRGLIEQAIEAADRRGAIARAEADELEQALAARAK